MNTAGLKNRGTSLVVQWVNFGLMFYVEQWTKTVIYLVVLLCCCRATVGSSVGAVI